MLKESGVVVEIDDKFAIVQTKRTSYCRQCAANKGCGTASLSAILGQKYTQVKVINHCDAKVGDRVVIGVEEQALLKSAFVLYLLPLLSLFAGAIGYEMLIIIGEWPRYEALIILAGLLGLFIGLIGAKKITFLMSKKTDYQPVIVDR